MTDAELAEIEARANAARKGPWLLSNDPRAPNDDFQEYFVEGPKEPHGRVGRWGFADAAFIASAREDVPALLAEVKRLRAELATVADAFDGCARGGHACGCGHAARAVRAILKQA